MGKNALGTRRTMDLSGAVKDRVGMPPASNPVRAAIGLIVIIFGTELAIMTAYSLTGADTWMPNWLQDGGDAILLGIVAGALIYYRMVVPQRRTLSQVYRLNRLLRFLSYINQSIRGQHDSRALFDGACSAAVQLGGFRFAWIGLLDTQRDGLKAAAMAGADEACMRAVRAAGNETALHCGMAKQALAQGRPAWCQALSTGDCAAAWRTPLLEHGCRSSAAFPLRRDESMAGVFAVYAGDSGYFHDDEIRILEEAAGDISFALTAIEQTRARKQTAQSLRERVNELERFQRATVDREFRIKELRDEIGVMKQKYGAPKKNKNSSKDNLREKK